MCSGVCPCKFFAFKFAPANHINKADYFGVKKPLSISNFAISTFPRLAAQWRGVLSAAAPAKRNDKISIFDNSGEIYFASKRQLLPPFQEGALPIPRCQRVQLRVVELLPHLL